MLRHTFKAEVLKEPQTFWVRDCHLLGILAAFITPWVLPPTETPPSNTFTGGCISVFILSVCSFSDEIPRRLSVTAWSCIPSHTYLLRSFPLLVKFQSVLPQLVHHSLVQIHLVLQSQTSVLQPIWHALPFLEETASWQVHEPPSILQHKPRDTAAPKLACVWEHSCHSRWPMFQFH